MVDYTVFEIHSYGGVQPPGVGRPFLCVCDVKVCGDAKRKDNFAGRDCAHLHCLKFDSCICLTRHSLCMVKA